MSNIIVSSGITSYGIILENNSMTVLNGGVANNTTVNGSGRLNLSSGGTASAVTLNSNGRLNISRGGTAEAVIENGGYAYVWDSATISFLPNTFSGIDLSSTSASVHSGTIANTVTVNSGGYLHVFAGGTANGTTVNMGGRFHISEGGKADNTTVNANGGMFVSGGGSATRVALNADGELIVFSGGFADGITAASGAAITVSRGATATAITAAKGVYLGLVVAPDTRIQGTSDGKTFRVQDSAISGFTIDSGFLNVSSGGSAKDVSVSANGRLTVYSGGKATGIRENGGNVSAMEGATIAYVANTFTGVQLANASATVHSGTTANSAVINSRGGLMIFSGGKAGDAAVNDGGSMFLYSGASANGVVVNSGGSMFLYSGGTVSNLMASTGAYLGIVVAPGTYIHGTTEGGTLRMENGIVSHYTVDLGSLSVSSGGTANGITVNSGGRLSVASGGVASAIVENGGYVNIVDGADVSFAANTFSGCVLANTSATVHSGTTADTAIVNAGGYLNVYGGGAANGTTVNSGGFLKLFSGGSTNGTIIHELGHLHITDGGVANDTIINGGDGAYRQGDLYISSGGTANGVTLNSAGSLTIIRGGVARDVSVNCGGQLYVSRGGTASSVVENGGCVNISDETDVSFVANTFSGLTISGSATLHSGTTADDTTLQSGARMFVYSGGRLTGRTSLGTGTVVSASGGTVDFDLTRTFVGAAALVNDLSLVHGTPVYTLTVNEDYKGRSGVVSLADGAAGFKGTLSVVNASGGIFGTLTVGGEALTVGDTSYSLNLNSAGQLSVTVSGSMPPGPTCARSDIDGNGISDVMFVWTGEHGEGNYQHGYWMNGTNTWQSAGSNHPADWDNLGCYDMTGDGKADSVLVGNVTTENGSKGAYIGYYADAIDNPDGSSWVNIGYLNNADDIAWKNAVGNLTGNESGANSIVWYAPERYALGVWTDGTENWVTLSNRFGGKEWTLIGCGDFDGDGKDQVVMSLNGGELYYEVGIGDALPTELAKSDSGWEVRAIGDFKGDGKDDIVAFHAETGLVFMWGDGNSANWSQLGQLDASDWFVVGCGDYDGDAKDDLLVRQYSTGTLGYYSSGDMAQWNTLGYGVDMSWTVIA